jgi:hypothetical protein
LEGSRWTTPLFRQGCSLILLVDSLVVGGHRSGGGLQHGSIGTVTVSPALLIGTMVEKLRETRVNRSVRSRARWPVEISDLSSVEKQSNWQTFTIVAVKRAGDLECLRSRGLVSTCYSDWTLHRGQCASLDTQRAAAPSSFTISTLAHPLKLHSTSCRRCSCSYTSTKCKQPWYAVNGDA